MINWTHWHNEPYLVAGLISAGWLYAMLAGPWRAILGGARFPTASALRFYGGLFIFYLTVGSPLDQIGERYLFWAHMIQHLLLVYPAALLILTGIPSWMLRPVTTGAVIGRFLRFLTHPIVATMVYITVLSGWHLPGLYDLALRDKAVHIIQHLSFFLSAILMWWPIASPSRELPPLPYGGQILYIFAVGLVQVPLCAFLTFSKEILYPTYAYAPRLMDLTPLEDQVLGGLIMTVGTMIAKLSVLTWAFYRWYQTSAQRQET
ncbi:MAG: cytochrome c oxidase assembly protein [Opitutaceae bacterium]